MRETGLNGGEVTFERGSTGGKQHVLEFEFPLAAIVHEEHIHSDHRPLCWMQIMTIRDLSEGILEADSLKHDGYKKKLSWASLPLHGTKQSRQG
jgi:hypothetical protein